MTINHYKRDLLDEFNVVTAGNIRNIDHIYKYTGKELKMDLTRDSEGRPTGDSLDEIIAHVETNIDMFTYEGDMRDETVTDFCNNYPAIIRGERPDWILNAFRPTVGDLHLIYINKDSKDFAFLDISGTKNLRLTFTAPRTVLGFIPTYKVYIEKRYSGDVPLTSMEEDLGYIRYDKEYGLLDPRKKKDRFSAENQYVEIWEYAGF